jgi:CDP-6-deoxy-D-xylo-4-hexulose-3-dehydrase
MDISASITPYIEEKLRKTFIPGKTYIPPSGPKLYVDDIHVLMECVLGMWYTEHKYCRFFAEAISEQFVGRPHVILCNSGSSASLLAITAACERFKSSKPYVVTCATTFPTTVTPIYLNGKTPFYIDIDPFTLQPDLKQLAKALDDYGDQICGVFLGHNLGFPFDEKAVRMMLGPDQWFISDICDSFGATLNDSPIGRFCDLAILSFFPAHHITSGEGGAVITYDEDMNDLVFSLSNWGRSCACLPGQQNTCGHRFDWPDRGGLPDGWDHKYIFDRPGFNLKMTELQAALGLSQMTHLSKFVAERRNNYIYLWDNLTSLPYLDFIQPQVGFSPFGFPVIVTDDAPFTPEKLIDYLEYRKVGTRRMFAGNIIRQPGFKDKPYMTMRLGGSDFAMRRMFWISCAPFLTPEMREYMVSVFKDFLGEM